MNPLRRLPTRKLLAMIAGVVVLGGSVTAVAVAALGGAGPIPPAKTLAAAIHDAINGPNIEGVTAQIQFTNNLIDSSSIPGSTPLLKGATGRLWASNDGHLRLELQSSRGDTEIIVSPSAFSVYDAASNTVYRGTFPAEKPPAGKPATTEPAHTPPTLQTITDALNKLMDKVGVSGADPTDVGGAPAYTVTLSPKHDGGLLGSAQLAFDAVNGAPLRLAVYAQGNSSPVLELKATDVSFGPVAPGNLTVAPPSSAKVVEVTQPASKDATAAGAHAHGKVQVKSGAAAVAAALPFKLDAPATLAGLPQTSVKLLSFGKKPAALVTYGQHLGAILVVERPTDAKAPAKSTGSSSDSPLPTVSINGASGTELATALGTFLTFDRGGVSYVVAGSVPPAAAEAAARGL
ncbi:MAG: hypothetical protein QOD61_79 [Solirubrobacteraceae bacterium]|nr:hypothetical protein [Solirubrobacteraceae bacterium]